MKKRIILYGAGLAGHRALRWMPRSLEVIAVVDDDKAKEGLRFCGHPIIAAHNIPEHNYDKIIITSWLHSHKLFGRLLEIGVPRRDILAFKKECVMSDKQFPWNSFFYITGLLVALTLSVTIIYLVAK